MISGEYMAKKEKLSYEKCGNVGCNQPVWDGDRFEISWKELCDGEGKESGNVVLCNNCGRELTTFLWRHNLKGVEYFKKV
jgi:hypothetical protein